MYGYNGQIMFSLWHFQDVIEAQEKTITNLLKAVKEQHDQLDHQKVKIKNLEEKVENCSSVQILLYMGMECEYGKGKSAFSGLTT